jgi:hypothetical protein
MDCARGMEGVVTGRGEWARRGVAGRAESNTMYACDLINHASVRRAVGAGLAAAVLLCGTAMAEPYEVTVLRALDKVTARISRIEAPVGQPVTFGTLRIIARTCDKRPPEEPPESAAFLQVEESRPNEVPVSVFRGWMFASSPAVSAMDHPVYDIWVLDCVSSASTAESTKGDSSG